uniref:DOMON domain-containing protein n=1 Tax=Rhabditophanes sp. KR3021 TaxID=114890 RepID=A0AC35TLI4_9BILA
MKRSQIVLIFALIATATPDPAVVLSRDGCGETKACLFKPPGCDPNLDCTMGAMFSVVGPNQLKIQLVAQSLIPTPNLQYIAIGFSKDALMGEDYVNECVLATNGNLGETGPEVFTSFNKGKTNDRTYLNNTELKTLFTSVKGEIINGRLTCEFVQQIVPQISSKSNRVLPLNQKYYILIATGSAQPDEVNVHDTSLSSQFYPIVSARPINPSLIGETTYDLPKPFVEDPNAPEPGTVLEKTTAATVEESKVKDATTKSTTENASSPSPLNIVAIISFGLVNLIFKYVL